MQDKSFIFFGTPYVASKTLAVLLDAGYIPKLVVTNPDARQGRGMVLTPSPVKILAEQHNIPVLTPEKLDAEAIDKIISHDCVSSPTCTHPSGCASRTSYAIVVAYGKIIPEVLINSFEQGILNIHYSLLPKYRGATPLEATLLNGDNVTGVTIQKMVYALDAGAIIAQEELPIIETETSRELRPKLIELGEKLLVNTLPAYLSGSIEPVAQDETKVSRCGKLTKADGELDLTADTKINWNKYRAYAEWPGTFFFKDGKRIKINTAIMREGVFTPLRVTPEGKKETDYI